jgi:hypothetical protein
VAQFPYVILRETCPNLPWYKAQEPSILWTNVIQGSNVMSYYIDCISNNKKLQKLYEIFYQVPHLGQHFKKWYRYLPSRLLPKQERLLKSLYNLTRSLNGNLNRNLNRNLNGNPNGNPNGNLNGNPNGNLNGNLNRNLNWTGRLL